MQKTVVVTVKRRAMHAKYPRQALVMTRDEAYYVPLHHQMRPWAMKKNVATLHRADDRPEARFARVD